jgi:hypothetical protein
MKLLIILRNEGFLTVEIMISFSLLILFTISIFTLFSTTDAMKIFSIDNLNKLKDLVPKVDQIILNDFQGIFEAEISRYGNDTLVYNIDPFILSHSDYITASGRNNCNSRIDFDKNDYEYLYNAVDIGAGNASTDIEARNGIVYLTADSAVSSKNDFYIVDSTDNKILSFLNTGPGVDALEVVGPYVFLAQASTINQLQILDIRDRSKPKLIFQFKLPLPTPTSIPPFATSIFYSKGYLYLGTEKWDGPELSIFDISNILDPKIVGTFETNTLINDIYERDDILYLATSDNKQMRVLDTKNKTNPQLIDSFSPSGKETQEGKILDYFEGKLGFGRTVGGFNVLTNHEIFIFGTSTNISNFNSKDIPGGVYGVVVRNNFTFLLTHFLGHEFQVFDKGLNKIFDLDLKSSPQKMSCDRASFYFATGNSKGFSVLKKKDE